VGKILRVVSAILIVLGLSSVANANGMKKPFQAVKPSQATLLQTNSAKKFCPVCGMTLPMFYKTNHAAQTDGHAKQFCSIHCLVMVKDMKNMDLKDIKVVDTTSLKFIDAKTAHYVIGSDKKATMSMVSKYAFASKDAALKFQNSYGGKIMSFDELVELVKKSQAKDMAATKKRQAKASKKGSMIYKKICKKTQKEFISTAQAKAFLKSSKICGDIKGKKLQAIGMYLVHQNL